MHIYDKQCGIMQKQARKLKDAQAVKLTGLNVDKLTKWQACNDKDFLQDPWLKVRSGDVEGTLENNTEVKIHCTDRDPICHEIETL